jgi:hypothetical protein
LYGYKPGEEMSFEMELFRGGYNKIASKPRAPGALAQFRLRKNFMNDYYRHIGKEGVKRISLDIFGVRHAYPTPDFNDPGTLVSAVSCRMAADVLGIDHFVQVMWFVFAERFLRPRARRAAHLLLDTKWYKSFERWAASMDKPAHVIESWREDWKRLGEDDWFLNMRGDIDAFQRFIDDLFGAFGKDEVYKCDDNGDDQTSSGSGGITPARGIMGVSNGHRVRFGDNLKMICNDFLAHMTQGHIVCGMTVDELTRYLYNYFEKELRVLGLDFSKFENWFIRFRTWLISSCVEHEIAKASPAMHAMFKIFTRMEISGEFRSKHFSGKTWLGHNPSGTFLTYFRNTVANYAMSKFVELLCTGEWPRELPTLEVHDIRDHDLAQPREVYGGDDGKAIDRGQRKELYDAIGVPVKFEGEGSAESVAFFKIYTVLKEDGTIGAAPDIEEMITKFMWISGKLKNAKRSKILSMYVAKAYSYLLLAPYSPVCARMCSRFLYENRHVDARSALQHLDSWHREKVERALDAHRTMSVKWHNGHHVWFQGGDVNAPLDFNILSETARRLGCSPDELRSVDEGVDFVSGRFVGLDRLESFFAKSSRNIFEAYVAREGEAFVRPTPVKRGERWRLLEGLLSVGIADPRSLQIVRATERTL